MFSPVVRHNTRKLLWANVLMILALALSSCAGMPLDSLPLIGQFVPPTPTFTPTPTLPPTPTPLPTPTPKPGETPLPPTPTPIPTPQVTIPQGFTVIKDDRLGYSFAVPRGWSELDLRSPQFQNMANMVGMGGQLGPLNDFLATPEGEMLGKIYITDLTAAMFGGLPTALAVTVAPAPGYTAESAKQLVEGLIQANAAMLGDVKLDAVDATTINGLPAVRSAATANLASVGMNASVFAKVVALLANEKIYVLTLIAQDNQRGAKEPIFDQIIGTFRPE